MSRGIKKGTLLSGPLLLAIVYIGFISLGLPDPVAGVAWPSVRDAFALSQSSFGLLFIAMGAGYCLSGFFGGKLTHALGLGNLLWVSSALVALAMFGSGFASGWTMIVLCAALWGLGSGGIDAGLNAFVSGHYSARHMNWLHACYSFGATLGPVLMMLMVVKIGAWRFGYHIVGGVLLLMTIAFFLTRRGWKGSSETGTENGDSNSPVNLRAALKHRVVQLQAVLFFLYTGLEFAVGQWTFTVLTESRNVRPDIAGMLAGAYYAAIGVGRVLSGAVANRIGLGTMVRVSMAVAFAGVTLFAFGPAGNLSHIGLVVAGLGLAPVFPCLMAVTPQRAGKGIAAHAVGFQVSAGMMGAALMPGFAGFFAEKFGLSAVPIFAVGLAVLMAVLHEAVLSCAKRK